MYEYLKIMPPLPVPVIVCKNTMFLYSNGTVLSRKILNLFITTVSSTVTVMVVIIKKILLNIYLLMYLRTGDTIQEIFDRFIKQVL